MMKPTLTATACTTLLWAGAALATPTPQQQCDSARITAWKTYQSCVEGVVAKDAKGANFCGPSFCGTFPVFAKCRHAYFKGWTVFQSRASLAGSTCIGPRFTDNGDQTVTDNLTGLVWEKKDGLGDIHDVQNHYSWSTGAPYVENGTAFTDFLATLNSDGFAGANGWRVATLAELQTTILDFPCTGTTFGPKCSCSSSPCVDPAIGLTVSTLYWSAASRLSNPIYAWVVDFGTGWLYTDNKMNSDLVRAVRGGL